MLRPKAGRVRIPALHFRVQPPPPPPAHVPLSPSRINLVPVQADAWPVQCHTFGLALH